jgi:hypothetical protein
MCAIEIGSHLVKDFELASNTARISTSDWDGLRKLGRSRLGVNGKPESRNLSRYSALPSFLIMGGPCEDEMG